MFIRSLAGTERKTRGSGLMRALLACCLAGMAMGLTGEAPWGNAWSDSAGVLATSFAPLSIFYTCSVRDLTYSTLAACNAACEMGESSPAQPPASTIRLETGSSRHGPVYLLAHPRLTESLRLQGGVTRARRCPPYRRSRPQPRRVACRSQR